jgi:hypothetical protein
MPFFHARLSGVLVARPCTLYYSNEDDGIGGLYSTIVTQALFE